MAVKHSTGAESVINPSHINPLIVTGPGEVPDTINLVNNVLSFVAWSMENAENEGDICGIDGSSHGVALILQCCQSALKYHFREGGAA